MLISSPILALAPVLPLLAPALPALPLAASAAARIAELEAELAEFQESSRELEQALEDELHALEVANEKAQYRAALLASQLAAASERARALAAEAAQLAEDARAQRTAHDAAMALLRQRLVEVEIAHDHMETSDRVLASKLEYATQFNGELLEKVAMLESDLERERQQAAQARLLLSNAQNSHPDDAGDVLVLLMREILRAGPPVLRVPHIPKSDSLKRLHELTQRLGALSQKAHSVREALVPGALKSPSTTLVSAPSEPRGDSRPRQRARLTARPRLRPARSISPSPSFVNLAQYARGTPLDAIDGSPAKPAPAPARHKSRRGFLLNLLKGLSAGR